MRGCVACCLAWLAPIVVPFGARAEQPAQDRSICDPSTGETAETIYRRARTRWDESTYADDIRYVIHISMTNGKTVTDLHYDGHVETYGNIVDVDAFSTEERAKPLAPHGIAVAIAMNGRPIRDLSKPLPTYDVIGVPRLTPLYSFGLGRTAAGRLPIVADAPSSQRGFKDIASVSAINREYAVSCVDSAANTEGTRIDHISLAPLVAPESNRIRELWIESGSYWTDRALVARNFTAGPPLRCGWAIDFAHDATGEQILQERALGPLDYGRNAKFEALTIRFEPIAATAQNAVDSFVFKRPLDDDKDDLREPQ